MEQHLHITWKLSNKIAVSDNPVHLDGVVAWGLMELATQYGESQEDALKALPFAKYTGKNGKNVYCASQIFFQLRGEYEALQYRRRFDHQNILSYNHENKPAIAFNGTKESVQEKVKYKSCDLRAETRHATFAEAWCIGDKNEINEALQMVTHLGKLTHLDYGRVQNLSIDECEPDNCHWYRRNMPEQYNSQHHVLTNGNLLPPYWDRKNVTQCWAWDGRR